MNSTPSRFALFCFTAFCLSALPLTAFAAHAHVDIDTNFGASAYGNSNDSGATADVSRPDGNTLNINNGGTASPMAYGAEVSGSGARSATGNTVNVNSGGTVTGLAIGAAVSSSDDAATASGNSANLAAGGTVGVGVTGGSAQASGSGAAIANGNTVTIDGTVGSGGGIYGGYAIGSGAAIASGNTVTINNNAIVSSQVIGGLASDVTSATASNNSVIINGGTVNADVTGGTAWSSGASAINNIVTVRGGTFGASSILKGGDFGMNSGDAFTGNTLNLHVPGLTVAGVSNFEYLNFYLPSTLTAGQTMLTVTGTADLTDGAGRSSTVNVGIEGGSSPLAVGDSVVLIDAVTLNGTPANTTANGRGMQGVTLLYGFDLLAQGNQLLATVTSVGVNPQLKSLSEGRVAGHAFLNQGSDLILGPGLNAMLAATQETAQSPAQGGLVPFFTGAGGWSRYDTGSHVDVSGVSVMTGLAWRQPVNEGKNGSVLAGAFFEAGWGNYDSHNSFSNAASVKGDGDLSYYGGGVLGRYDFAPVTILGGPGNLYLDVSFRAGQADTEFNSSDLRDGTGRKADYDSSSTYYGMHAGIGYLWNITDKASLDLSTRYIWTHQDSDTVKVLGDPVKFKDTDSHRWRTGARFAYAMNEYIAPYAGAYYDHEFDGKARASTSGYGIDAPDLKGGTGIGELGLTLKPSQTLPLSFDLGVQGYTGVREGVTGSLQVKFEF